MEQDADDPRNLERGLGLGVVDLKRPQNHYPDYAFGVPRA